MMFLMLVLVVVGVILSVEVLVTNIALVKFPVIVVKYLVKAS